MKRLVLLLPVLLLAGCFATAVPVKHKFPGVPSELMEACPELKLVDSDETQLSEILKVVTANYGEYQQCKIKLDAWVEWYKTQKKIYEDAQ